MFRGKIWIIKRYLQPDYIVKEREKNAFPSFPSCKCSSIFVALSAVGGCWD